jgi:hypothetical protein
MPIRINLLAEEQAAEEMRRRDPIKRALWVGSVLMFAMIVWIALTQMNVNAARSELAGHEARVKQLEDSSKTVRANQMLAADTESKVRALDKYSTNRFLWGTLLDAVQLSYVDNIRLVEVRADQRYGFGDVNKILVTNLMAKYTPPPAWWKIWAKAAPVQPVETSLASNFQEITNKAPFTTNTLTYKITTKVTSTNLMQKVLMTSVEFTTVPWAMENIVVEIRGRDYGNPPGAAIDEFARRIQNSPFFKEWLEPGSGFRFMERPPQPRPDPSDPVNPNALFVPFAIELRFQERIFTNE